MKAPRTLPRSVVGERLAAILRSLSAEELEERVAPVKCSKHPDSPECGEDYGVAFYMAPSSDTPEG